MVTPSPFDDDFERKEKRIVTMHYLDPVYDERGYVKEYGRLVKEVYRDIVSNKIISILPA